MPNPPMDRRSFLKYSAATAAALVPGAAWAQQGQNRPAAAGSAGAAGRSANGKLNVASIGCGGMGKADLEQIAAHPDVQIVALCDVDARRAAESFEKFPDARRFTDFREMFQAMGDKLDAVHVSTPDHTHAAAAMTALNHDKHVYTQKPLTHDIYEARQLAKVAAAKPKLATQMGTQNASRVQKRQALALLADPAKREQTVGRVMAIYGWSDRPVGWWPQGEQRPEGKDPVPDTMKWDLWLGTAAERPYKEKAYAPFVWRGFYDFGCGALGDMAAHIMDTAYYALDLGHAQSVVSHSEDATDDMFPSVQHSVLVYPGNEASGGREIPMYWFDGGAIPTPAALRVPGKTELKNNGCVVVGEKASLVIYHEGEPPMLFDREKEIDIAPMLPELEQRNHWHHWVDAALGRNKTDCRFEVAGPLTEQLCLGAIAGRFPHQTLLWDGEAMTFKNSDAANKLVRRTYRKGFEVENL